MISQTAKAGRRERLVRVTCASVRTRVLWCCAVSLFCRGGHIQELHPLAGGYATYRPTNPSADTAANALLPLVQKLHNIPVPGITGRYGLTGLIFQVNGPYLRHDEKVFPVEEIQQQPWDQALQPHCKFGPRQTSRLLLTETYHAQVSHRFSFRFQDQCLFMRNTSSYTSVFHGAQGHIRDLYPEGLDLW